MDGPFPKVSLKHLPAGNLHRVPVVHTVWGKHTLCKWFFFWNGAHTTRDRLLMATVSAKANSGCAWFLTCPLNWMHSIRTCLWFPWVRTTASVCARRNANAGGSEKQVPRKKGLHVPANPQKQCVKCFDVAKTGRDCHNTRSDRTALWQRGDSTAVVSVPNKRQR